MKRGTAWSDQEADQRVKYTQCTPEFVEWATAHEQNRDGAWVDPANRMSEQAIAQAEAKWGIVFPPDYRAFLSLAGPGKSMIRWDGTQDKAIAELYAKLEESLMTVVSWGVWNESEWGPKPEEAAGGTEEEGCKKAQAVLRSLYGKSRKLIPLTHRHFTFSHAPGQTEACMSLALGFGTNVFDVQDIMMVGDNFTRFFQFKCFTVADFAHVNSDPVYAQLKRQPIWGNWVN